MPVACAKIVINGPGGRRYTCKYMEKHRARTLKIRRYQRVYLKESLRSSYSFIPLVHAERLEESSSCRDTDVELVPSTSHYQGIPSSVIC